MGILLSFPGMFRDYLKTALHAILRGLAWLLIGAGGLSFWVGGRAIHEFLHVERFLAEPEGLALAILLLVLGFGVRALSGPE